MPYIWAAVAPLLYHTVMHSPHKNHGGLSSPSKREEQKREREREREAIDSRLLLVYTHSHRWVAASSCEPEAPLTTRAPLTLSFSLTAYPFVFYHVEVLLC